VAAAAAAEMNVNYVANEERTSIDLLPPLGEDSVRNLKADPGDLDDPEDDHDPMFDMKTVALNQPPPPPDTSTANTAPRGVPALTGGQIPTIYYFFAFASVVVIVLIAWLIAR
jgi:hypothetical protein